MKKLYFSYILVLVFSTILLSCNTDDDQPAQSDQYLKADINGLAFNTDENLSSLSFFREIGPAGRVNLYVKAISSEGDMMQFLIENYNGTGKYYIGNNLYNNSWISYERPSTAELWTIQPKGALNLTSNFIEITSNDDNLIEGKLSCRELRADLNTVFGVADGEFRLVNHQ